MRLFIVRHGESQNNLLNDQLSFDDYLQQRFPDPALTELGLRQAEAVADHLAKATVAEHYRLLSEGKENGYNITRIYCSAMLRAMQTAQPIGQALGIDPEVLIDIHEQGGVFIGDPRGPESIQQAHGITRAQALEQFPGYKLPAEITENGWWYGGWEDAASGYARAVRIAAFMHKMAANNRNSQQEGAVEERVVLVAQGDFIDALIKALLHNVPADDHFYVHYNTAITRIDFHEDRLLLRYINRTEHFTPELFAASIRESALSTDDGRPGY